MDWIGRYLLALGLTVVIEGAIVWLFGWRSARSLLADALINCLTNPPLNLGLLLLAWRGVAVNLALVSCLEVVVVLAEWLLLIYALGGPARRLLLLSLFANAASFLVGVWLFWS